MATKYEMKKIQNGKYLQMNLHNNHESQKRIVKSRRKVFTFGENALQIVVDRNLLLNEPRQAIVKDGYQHRRFSDN